MKKIISKRSGKVRDIYTLDSGELLMVASDRISVFDGKLPTPIPGKGKILNQISEFWFRWIDQNIPNIKHHCITTNLDEMDVVFAPSYFDPPAGNTESPIRYLTGRTMLCKQLQPLPIEAIVRGHLVGSGWKEYQEKGTLAGGRLPEGILLAGTMPDGPVFTPSTKAENGHDENISCSQMREIIGGHAGENVEMYSLELYQKAYTYARTRGIIIADTKFEWALERNEGDRRNVYLIDEVLTPDSSRFWDIATYQPGTEPPSLDKDNVRRWAKSIGYKGEGEAPVVPSEIVEKTQQTYIEVFKKLTGKEPVL